MDAHAQAGGAPDFRALFEATPGVTLVLAPDPPRFTMLAASDERLAVMSHELRTPLNAIGGYAELLELGLHGPVTPAQRTALERIQRSQRHLLGLIAGVLDFSRLEAGTVRYDITDVRCASRRRRRRGCSPDGAPGAARARAPPPSSRR